MFLIYSLFMREVERLRTKVFTEQVNVSVDMETKARLERLKREHRVNTAAEIRKAILRLVSDLENAVSSTHSRPIA
jgi:hypothetical protein